MWAISQQWLNEEKLAQRLIELIHPERDEEVRCLHTHTHTPQWYVLKMSLPVFDVIQTKCNFFCWLMIAC